MNFLIIFNKWLLQNITIKTKTFDLFFIVFTGTRILRYTEIWSDKRIYRKRM